MILERTGFGFDTNTCDIDLIDLASVQESPHSSLRMYE